MGDDFYVRYYVGHKGKFGHEFLEFEFRPDGKLRYANNSNYKNDTMIRKEVFVTPVSNQPLSPFPPSLLSYLLFSCYAQCRLGWRIGSDGWGRWC
jgi:hypothetical protein